MFPMIVSESKTSPPRIPFLTFFGPNDTSQITAIYPTGQEAARFTLHGDKSSFSIFRIVNTFPNAPPIQMCTAEKSSLSGSTTMTVHGQNVKVTESRAETGSLGTLKFSESSSADSVWKLKDKQGIFVAQGHVDEAKLEVFVPGDEATLDVFLAVWVAFARRKGGSSSASKGTSAALAAVKLVATLSGIPVGN